jgi:hypothetical protein
MRISPASAVQLSRTWLLPGFEKTWLGKYAIDIVLDVPKHIKTSI